MERYPEGCFHIIAPGQPKFDFNTSSGLDIGYVPRASGFFFFFSASYAAIIFTGNRQNSEGNVNSYLFFRYI